MRSRSSALPVSPNLRVRREGCYPLRERRLNKRSYINSYKNLSLNNTLKSIDKYTNYLTVFIFVCLFWIKFINIYFSSNFAADIDSFVNVYNHIKNQ